MKQMTWKESLEDSATDGGMTPLTIERVARAAVAMRENNAEEHADAISDAEQELILSLREVESETLSDREMKLAARFIFDGGPCEPDDFKKSPTREHLQFAIWAAVHSGEIEDFENADEMESAISELCENFGFSSRP